MKRTRPEPGGNAGGPPQPSVRAARELEALLKRKLRGEVDFGRGARALYATDSSNYRQAPVGVICPWNAEDVEEALTLCRRYEAAVTSRGGGTSLAGQTCNAAVIFDFSRHMNRLVQLDAGARRVRVEPGIVLDSLHTALREQRLRFGPDPSTHNSCTLGGMIGNNSCGTHSVLAAFVGGGPRTSDNLAGLEVITYDGTRLRVGPTPPAVLSQMLAGGGRAGEIFSGLAALRDRYGEAVRQRFPRIPRRVSGFNLDELLPENEFNVARALAGTEGTCALILEAELDLIETPAESVLVVLGYRDVFEAGDRVTDLMQSRPSALEGMDQRLIADMRTKGIFSEYLHLLPEGGGWLLVEFSGASREEAREQAERLMQRVGAGAQAPAMACYEGEEEQEAVWNMRESGLGVTAHVPDQPDAWEGWEDSAVPPERLGDYMREFRALLDRFGYDGPFYGHFGQGIVHTRLSFDLKSKPGIDLFKTFLREAADLVVRFGGSLSGEHGDGQSRAELLDRMFGPDLVRAFGEFKRIWDPQGRLNPHKVVEPYRVDENLRLGADYNPAPVKTHFQFPDDKGSFAYALERCVGVGSCRKTENGTMCPSYQVTREEQHCTRGRSRLLFEMLQGKVIGKRGWRDGSVHQALSLCLACKACKAECPVNVDMATYKAEFRSHYYKRRLRPRSAYAMGLIYWWARAATHVPSVANFFTQRPPLASLMKKAGGIAPGRRMPKFAPESFTHWFQRRGSAERNGRRVLLWPDTFNNYFRPGTARAAVEVLEAAGFQVAIPHRPLCCGRPLYDFGMLSTAKRLLRQILDTLREEIRAGTLVVGLEPSCVAVFRDELCNLFPRDQDARRLRQQTRLLSEFLQEEAADWEMPRLPRQAILHPHCHHRAIMKIDAEKAVLRRMGIDFRDPDAGCCGMAGSFGFEHENYDVSVACAERKLLPALREAGPEVLVLADGFSCREQIEDLAGGQPLHLAEVLALACRGKEADLPTGR